MKIKLTLGLIAGILGLGGCAANVHDETTQRLLHAANRHLEASKHRAEWRPLTKGVRDAIAHTGNNSKLLGIVYEGLFYKANFDINGDGLPDYFMMGRWMYENGKKVPSTDFFLACRIRYGDTYVNEHGKVQQDRPDIQCNYRGRDWVTPEYIVLRMSGEDPYTTPEMRKEK